MRLNLIAERWRELEGVGGEELTIYCDIDGTLTKDGEHAWGAPVYDRIGAVKSAIANGHEVHVWSARGEKYAKQFCERYGLSPSSCLSKPDVCFDDIPELRGRGRMTVLAPDAMWPWMSAHGVPCSMEREAK